MKVLYTATMLSHICQFHLPHLKRLREEGNEVHVAANDNLAVKNGLELKYTDCFFDIPFERSPFAAKNYSAYKKLKEVINNGKYDLIICNTPVGGILTRIACKDSRKHGAKVIYVAHGFHFYKGAPKTNWVMYYPLEKYMANLCDAVVTINYEDYKFAKEHFPGKVMHIHGVGVSSERYHPAELEKQEQMRETYGLENNDFVIICTGELNENKNQKTLIDAVAILKNSIPNLKVLLAGNGPSEEKIKEHIKSLKLEKNIKLLGYRTDLEQIVPAVDLVVSCSRREGLPLNIIEAMLCKKPVVASINRGHSELIDDQVNGFLIQADDPQKFAERILTLYENGELKQNMGEAGFQKAQKYTVDSVAEEIRTIIKEVVV